MMFRTSNSAPLQFCTTCISMRIENNIWQLIITLSMLLTGLTGVQAMVNETTAGLHQLVQGLPETVEEWRKSPESSVYDSDNLYTYINGGAELYISYQFSDLISQPYINADNEEIKIDIFDMGSPENAYGIFLHSLENIDDFVGSEIDSEYAGGLLTFWKGPYYVSILAYPETESRKQVVQRLARKISDQIEIPSVRPKLVARLPKGTLQPYSIRYLKHFTWLNMYHFFSNENLLNIDDQTEVVMARYTVDGPKAATLILLQYPNVAAAAEVHETFRHTFMAGAEAEYAHGPDQLWTGCVRNQDLLMIVVDAPSQETAQNLLQGVELP